MASSATTLLKLEDQTTGENDGSWGTIFENNLNRLEEAIAGEAAFTVTGADVTLTDTQYLTNQARKAVLAVTGTLTGNRAIIVPARTKLYVVKNGTSGSFTLTIKVSGQTGVTVAQGTTAIVYCNGTDVEMVMQGPATVTDNTVPRMDGTGGKKLQSSGVVIDDSDNMTVPGALTITGGQIVFPSTQAASSNANTLDDYEEGAWTPALTFATAGNLVATASVASGFYTKIGNFVLCTFTLTLTTFTHTTASGNASLTGLPFANHSAVVFGIGDVEWRGITKSGATDVSIRSQPDSTLLLTASLSGGATAAVTASDMPTGGTVEFRGSIAYRTA